MKNLRIPISIAIMMTVVLAGNLALSEDALPADDVRELESKAASFAVSGDWDGVLSASGLLVEASDNFKERFLPLFAYASWKTGDKERAGKALEGRADGLSLAIKLVISGGAGAVPQLSKEKITGAEVFFVKVPKRNGNSTFTILPKSASAIALKSALYAFIESPTVDDLKFFNERILSRSSVYFLSGAVISEDDDTITCITVVDAARLTQDMSGAASKGVEKLRVGVVTRTGGDKIRKLFIDRAAKIGSMAEDMGRGDFYALGERAKSAGIVVEIAEDSRLKDALLESKFKNIDGSLTFTFYNASTGKPLTELTERSSIVHIDVDKGKELVIARSYEKIAERADSVLRELLAGAESFAVGQEPLSISASTGEIFSSGYKFYAKNPLGKIVLKNNTPRAFGSVKVSLSIKDYTDYPTEILAGELAASSVVTKDLNVVFNARILDITDDTTLQSEIKVSYIDMGEYKAVTATHPIYVYEKHALTWDDKGRIASFITPKDPVVIGFATAAASGYRSSKLNKNIVKARAVFAGMGVLGLEYMEDPAGPYGVVSGISGVVDYVQFPRETLVRKVGDCDDLTSLYSSALESLGIRTRLIDAPGHVFMMFDTEVPEGESLYFGFPEESYAILDGSIWIPVETTLAGSSFSEAWKKGAQSYNKGRGTIKVVDLNEARQLYKAPNLLPAVFRENMTKEDIEKKFPGEIEKLEKERLEFLAVTLEGIGTYGLMKLMQIYAKDGELTMAAEAGKKLAAADKSPAVFNNVGNVYYLKGEFSTAIKYYNDAITLDPGDAGTFVNLSRAYLKNGAKDAAKNAFEKAIALDPGIKEKYGSIYVELQK